MNWVSLFSSAIEYGVIFLFGCLGEILIEKSGHLNLGIPGTMCGGAVGGCLGVKIYMMSTANPVGAVCILVAVLFAILFAVAFGLIYAFLTVTLRANQNVTGLALTIFGLGLSSFLFSNVVLSSDPEKTLAINGALSAAGLGFFKWYPPVFDKLGWFGQIFLQHGALAYLAILLSVFFAVLLKKTRVGLNLRAIGENPATADAAGLKVSGYKYAFILIGSAVAGLGGLCYVMEYMGGMLDTDITTIASYGWLAIALVIFTLWKPDLAILGSILFGALFILPAKIGFSGAGKKLMDMVPYIVTIVVLIVTSIRGKKEFQPPASLGLSYFREDR